MTPRRRLTILLLTISMVAVSCGGAGDDTGDVALDDAGGPLYLEIDPAVVTATRSLIATLGVPGAVDAVVLAVDSGYGADQLITAASAGGLRADGMIIGVDGGIDAPDGDAAGAIDRGGSVEPSAAADLGSPVPLVFQEEQVSTTTVDRTGTGPLQRPFNVETYREFVRDTVEEAIEEDRLLPATADLLEAEADAEDAWAFGVIMTILTLAQRGFSGDLILDSFLFDAVITTYDCNDFEDNFAREDCEAAGEDIRCTTIAFADGEFHSFGRRCDDDIARPAPTPESDDPTGPGVVVLTGLGDLFTTDRGDAMSCLEILPVTVTIHPDQRAEISYVRTVAAGLPPGVEVGSGDVNQYVECVDANRQELHRGVFDGGAGTIGGFDREGVTADVVLTVTDEGLTEMTGTITATDFLNDWTVEFDLVECTRDCG